MRSMWKGSLGFGMVAIPVKMYKAVEDKAIHFNQLHQECNTRIQMPKYYQDDASANTVNAYYCREF